MNSIGNTHTRARTRASTKQKEHFSKKIPKKQTKKTKQGNFSNNGNFKEQYPLNTKPHPHSTEVVLLALIQL